MRVYVTGGSGFVGRRLVPHLLNAGHGVTASDREVDVTDPRAMADAFSRARPDAVIHLAAQSSVAASWRDPAIAYRVNFLGTRSVLRALASRAPGARLLLVGSGDQYTPSSPGSAAMSEREPLRPRSPYARSKAAAEQLGSLAAAAGLDVVRIRAFNHTGAGQSLHFVASDFARQIAQMSTGSRPAEMRVGNLDSVRDFLHVDDVIDAYLRLLEPTAPADIYNVASGEGTSIRSLLETLCELAGVSPSIEVDPKRFRQTDWVRGDATRLRQATGWRPVIPLRQALLELLEYWQAQPDEGPPS